jgi:DNA-binding IclR family transcriptional regulator
MSGHIEFKTGRLIDKYKKPLSRTDLINITKFSHNKIDKLLKDMKSNGLLEHNSEGYFISRKFIKKGAKQ